MQGVFCFGGKNVYIYILGTIYYQIINTLMIVIISLLFLKIHMYLGMKSKGLVFSFRVLSLVSFLFSRESVTYI